MLQALLQACRKEGGARPELLLAELTPADEQRLLKVIRSLGQLDTVHTLLKVLYDARPRSPAVREAYVESVLVKAKDADRPLPLDRGGAAAAAVGRRQRRQPQHAGRPAQPARLSAPA